MTPEEEIISVYRALLLDHRWDMHAARASAIDDAIAKVRPPALPDNPTPTDKVFFSDLADASDLAFIRSISLRVFLTLRSNEAFHRALASIVAEMTNDKPERLFEASWRRREAQLDNNGRTEGDGGEAEGEGRSPDVGASGSGEGGDPPRGAEPAGSPEGHDGEPGVPADVAGRGGSDAAVVGVGGSAG